MTGILARKREFAMLQAVGMTGRQLKRMLMLESLLWFFEYHFDITAVWITAPIFIVMGILLPPAVYRMLAKRTIVERLRETE